MQGITKTFTVKGTKGTSARVTVTEEYNIAANTSTLSVAVAVACSTYYGHTYYLDGTISAAGQTLQTMDSFAGTHNVTISKLNTYYDVNGSGAPGSPWGCSVTHNMDGTKTVTVAVDFKGYERSGKAANGFAITGSASVTLTHIPRASTIGATDANIGAGSVIAVSRKSTDYTHSIAYAFGGLAGYLTSDGGITDKETKFTATSIPFALPESFYYEIPGNPTGKCTLTCTTYLGSTQIGEKQTCVFTVTAAKDQCAPLVTAQAEDVNEATVALTGNSAVLVRYASNAKCTITATPRFGAAVHAKTVEGTAVEDAVILPAKDRYVFAATDSRGYTTSVTLTPKVIPYVILTCRATAKRDDPTSGKATLTVSGECYQGSFGAAENALTLRYRVGGGDWVTLTPAFTDHTYTATAALTGLNYTQRHTITVEAADHLATVTAASTVEKGIPVFDWGETDFTFHVPVNMDADIELQDHNLLKNGNPLKAEDVGAAPSGFGLGNSVSCDWATVDYITAPGWYKFSGAVSVGGMTFYSPFMRIDGWDANHCTQVISPHGAEAICLTRRNTGGVWGEWEWINPPMSPNVEYRTTERHNGKVVYTKLVQFGALPNKTEKSVTAMPAGSSLIEAVGYASGASYNVAIPGYYAIQSFGSTRSSGTLWLSTTIDMSSYNGWITIKYHKE
ncbi:MAG: hypothetical protein J6K98_01735 [Clostridia bacterium]|nr:hypothetical protein [Clostridia bacterium]